MMILNGMAGQNLKLRYCVVILIMKRVTHTMPKVVVETFKPPLISYGNERFFLIDSHSRNSEGLVDPYTVLLSSWNS